MNIPRQKTKFELYSLVNLSYNDNDKKVLSDMTLHRIGVNSNNADITKLKKDTNIEFEYSLEETLKEIIDHLLSHQKENISLAKQTPTNREVTIGGIFYILTKHHSIYHYYPKYTK